MPEIWWGPCPPGLAYGYKHPAVRLSWNRSYASWYAHLSYRALDSVTNPYVPKFEQCQFPVLAASSSDTKVWLGNNQCDH